MAVCGYLLGMAFAGSFLGRKWMGSVDVALHKVLKREVTIGLQNTDRLEVLEGLSEGERVVVDGNFGLEEGIKIEITEVVQ